MTKRHAGGRPRLPPEQKRTPKIVVRLTPTEHQLVMERAAKASKEISVYARERVLA